VSGSNRTQPRARAAGTRARAPVWARAAAVTVTVLGYVNLRLENHKHGPARPRMPRHQRRVRDGSPRPMSDSDSMIPTGPAGWACHHGRRGGGCRSLGLGGVLGSWHSRARAADSERALTLTRLDRDSSEAAPQWRARARRGHSVALTEPRSLSDSVPSSRTHARRTHGRRVRVRRRGCSSFGGHCRLPVSGGCHGQNRQPGPYLRRPPPPPPRPAGCGGQAFAAAARAAGPDHAGL
jgi:hypothetical protein